MPHHSSKSSPTASLPAIIGAIIIPPLLPMHCKKKWVRFEFWGDITGKKNIEKQKQISMKPAKWHNVCSKDLKDISTL